jgi:hypothetical protein
LNVVYKCKNWMPNLFARERENSGTRISKWRWCRCRNECRPEIATRVVLTDLTGRERKETTITMRYCSWIKLQGGPRSGRGKFANSHIRSTRNRPAAGESHQVDQPLGKFLVLGVAPLWKLGHTCLTLNTSSAYWITNILKR